MRQRESRQESIYRLGFLLLALLAAPAQARNPCDWTQPVSQPVVCIDHEEPEKVTIRLPNGADRSPQKGSVSVPTEKPFTVVVYNTQTALFTYAASNEPIELKTLEELQKFTGGLGSYLLEAAKSLGGPLEVSDVAAVQRLIPEPCTSWEDPQKKAYRDSVDAAGDLLQKLNPLASAQNRFAVTLREIQQTIFWTRRYAETIEDQSPVGRDKLEKAFDAEGRLKAYNELTTIYNDLEALRPKIDAAPLLIPELRALAAELSSAQACARVAQECETKSETSETSETSECTAAKKECKAAQQCDPIAGYLGTLANNLEERVELFDELVNEREKILRDTAAVEAFGWKLLQSKTFWQSLKPIKLDFDTGQKLTVAVKRSDEARLARAKTKKKPFETTVKLLPDNFVRPAVSLALLYADKAEFSEFGTKKIDEGLFEVVEKDRVDRRAAYALGLSLTFRGLDQRDQGGHFAYWPVELYVNPSDSDRALGVGQAVSWKFLKLSVGVLWTRHKELGDGLALGDLLAAEGALKTRDSYGSPEFYFGISVTGWAPFKK